MNEHHENHAVRSRRARAVWRKFAGVLIVGFGCAEPSDSEPPIGPPGAIIEVDTEAIPLGGSPSSQAGATAAGSSARSAGGADGGGTAGSTAGSQSAAGAGLSGGTTGGNAGSGGALARIGDPCRTNLDCPPSTFCNEDTLDYIGHRQCTRTCTSSSECLDLDGGTFCIGANLCVRACTSSIDCPALTRCNVAGWCERSGPGSGVPHCSGVATSCSSLSSTSCELALGCSDDSSCSGAASSCYSQFSSYACISQDGCVWSSSSSSCSGLARSCSSMLGSSSCGSQRGCSWRAGCTGVASACSTLPASLCALQPGCLVEY